MAAAETDVHYTPSGHPNDGHHDVHMIEQQNGGGMPDALPPTHLDSSNGDHHQSSIQQPSSQLQDTRPMAPGAALKPPPYRDPMPKVRFILPCSQAAFLPGWQPYCITACTVSK